MGQEDPISLTITISRFARRMRVEKGSKVLLAPYATFPLWGERGVTLKREVKDQYQESAKDQKGRRRRAKANRR